MSARFLALAIAIFLILFPGIAGCTIADMFIATAHVVESLGETATDATISALTTTAEAMKSLGETATDATVGALTTTAEAMESLGETATDAKIDALATTAKAVEHGVSYVAENFGGSATAPISRIVTAVEEKPEVYDGGDPERMNLVLGGIRQTEDAKKKYKLFADNNSAKYIPAYYSRGENLEVNEDDPTFLIKAAINRFKMVADGIAVQTAYSSIPTYENGLANEELKGTKYGTIIAYSGGTATAVAALLMQGVRCENLILISPMDAAISADDYSNMIDYILEVGSVSHIQILWSPDDHPTTEWAMFYQASTFTASDKVSIKQVDLSDSESGIDAHGDILEYAIANIRHGEFIDPDIAAAKKTAKEKTEENEQLSRSELPAEYDTKNVQETAQQEEEETQENSVDGFDPYLEGRKLAAEAIEETYQSTETSSDIMEGSEQITSAVDTAKSTDESKIQESPRITLYPVTNPPPDEEEPDGEVLLGISQDLEQFSQAISPSTSNLVAKNFHEGDNVVTTDLLNVRSEPGLPADSSYDTRISEPKDKGSTGIILSDPPIYEDGFTWWKIQYDDGTIGWSQDKRLELQQTGTRQTASQEKQPETQEASNAEFGPYSEGKKLAAEAFGETNAKEGTGIRKLHSATNPPDESSTKERSEIRTLHPGTGSSSDEPGAQEGQESAKLYPITSPLPDESDANSNALQLSSADPSDYTFLQDGKESSNLEWAVKGSGDKGRPAYKPSGTAAGFRDNTQPIQSQRSSSIDRANSNSNSIVGEWNVIQITTPHDFFGGSIKIQFVATFSPDGSVSRPRQQQGKMWIGASTGSWTQNGDSVRWTIAEVTHEGTVQGNRMSGVIYSDGGQSSWSAERV